ncbi:hypothetical protein TNCV_603991 [Trichonephila clavipes]|nr:hypothetical protein TNCV_603991 [Trichonephila clavipes]
MTEKQGRKKGAGREEHPSKPHVTNRYSECFMIQALLGHRVSLYACEGHDKADRAGRFSGNLWLRTNSPGKGCVISILPAKPRNTLSAGEKNNNTGGGREKKRTAQTAERGIKKKASACFINFYYAH